MLLNIYKSTLKQIIRSPITLTGFVLALLTCFFGRSEYRIGIPDETGELVLKLNYIRTINGCVEFSLLITCIILLAVFAISALYDKDNFFYDIELATGMKQRSYIAAKVFAFLTSFFSCLIILTVLNFSSFYIFGLVNIKMPFIETLVRFVAEFVYAAIPLGIFFVCLIMAVTTITKQKSFGIVIGALYIVITYVILEIPSEEADIFLYNGQVQGDLSLLWPPYGGIVSQATFHIITAFILFLLLYWILPKLKSNLFD